MYRWIVAARLFDLTRSISLGFARAIARVRALEFIETFTGIFTVALENNLLCFRSVIRSASAEIVHADSLYFSYFSVVQKGEENYWNFRNILV